MTTTARASDIAAQRSNTKYCFTDALAEELSASGRGERRLISVSCRRKLKSLYGGIGSFIAYIFHSRLSRLIMSGKGLTSCSRQLGRQAS